eukprot:scaffold145966_cov32-Tisochrysis_lutea.AAC.1
MMPTEASATVSVAKVRASTETPSTIRPRSAAQTGDSEIRMSAWAGSTRISESVKNMLVSDWSTAASASNPRGAAATPASSGWIPP